MYNEHDSPVEPLGYVMNEMCVFILYMKRSVSCSMLVVLYCTKKRMRGEKKNLVFGSV